MARHKSGLDILAGSEQFDRPNAQDAGAIEELLRVLAKIYDYIVIDAGNMINALRGRGAVCGRHGLPGHQPRRAVDPQRAAARRSACASSAPAASGSRCC